jgi:hypothetical protein
MADGDKIITLPDDDDRIPRTQDQRGDTGRSTNATKLEGDVEAGLAAAEALKNGKNGTETGDDAPDAASAETVADLRRKLARETQDRKAAEARADAATATSADALDAKTQADLSTLKTAKDSLTSQQDELKRRLAAAHADGDFDAIADINLKMSQSAVSMSNIENGIIALENAPKQREALARRGESGDDRFRAITKGMDPAAKQWFRDNPEYYADTPEGNRKLQRVVAAHNMVMTGDDPPEPNTPEYFAMVEAELRDPKFKAQGRTDNSGGREFEDDDTGDEPRSGAASGTRRDAPPASAPVSRNGRATGSSGTGPNDRQVRLTPQELEIADATGQTPEEFARNKRALVREGRLGPNARNRQMH